MRGIDLKQPVNQDTIDAIREDVTKCAAASDCFFHAIQPCVAAPADPLSRLLWPLAVALLLEPLPHPRTTCQPASLRVFFCLTAALH